MGWLLALQGPPPQPSPHRATCCSANAFLASEGVI